MIIALYQPDIPQNTGSALRLCACLGAGLHIIEPCGFPLDDRKLKRVSMDYGGQADITRHRSWETFQAWARSEGRRILLLSTKAAQAYTPFSYREKDILLCGRESGGVPDAVHEAADARLTIPMQPGARSLNMVMAAALVLGEARRQLGLIPHVMPSVAEAS